LVKGLSLGSVARRGAVKDFTREIVTDKQPATLLMECISEWSSQLAKHNYVLTTQSEAGLSFHKRYWPKWAIVVAVLFFPLGLVALFAKDDATITATFTPSDSGTVMLVSGKAPKSVVHAFQEMEV
jgi:hypothetical protein